MSGEPRRAGTVALAVVALLTASFVVSFGGRALGSATAGHAAPGELTLAEAIQRALERSPSLTLARFDVEEAAIGLQEAELGQLVGNPRSEVENARRALDEARDAYRDELVRIALQVEEAYYKVLGAADELEIQQSTVEQAEGQFALTRARYEAGLIARQDFLEAELRRDESAAALHVARRRLADARRELHRLVGLTVQSVESSGFAEPGGLAESGGFAEPDGLAESGGFSESDELAEEVPALRDEFPFAPLHIELEAAVAEALARRPEIERAQRAVQQARSKIEQAEATFAAPVDRRRAEMEWMRAEIRLDQALQDVEMEVRTAWHGLADLERGADTAARREELALGRVEISRARYAAGTVSMLQLLQDEEAYAKARQDAAAAVWNYNLARARFLRTLGRPELPPLPEAVATYIESWQQEP